MAYRKKDCLSDYEILIRKYEQKITQLFNERDSLKVQVKKLQDKIIPQSEKPFIFIQEGSIDESSVQLLELKYQVIIYKQGYMPPKMQENNMLRSILWKQKFLKFEMRQRI